MKTKRIIYWIATILLSAVFIYSASMYFLNTEMIEGFFKSFNYPTYLVIPLAIVKILAIITIVIRFNKWVTEWAYAGLFFNLVLATAAHINAGDGLGLSVLAIPILFISYFLGKQVRP